MQNNSLEQILINNKPHDMELSRCWYFVERGLEACFFDVYYVRELMNRLHSHRSFDFGSVDFKVDGDNLTLDYFGEEARCSLRQMIDQLRMVLDIYESKDYMAPSVF